MSGAAGGRIRSRAKSRWARRVPAAIVGGVFCVGLSAPSFGSDDEAPPEPKADRKANTRDASKQRVVYTPPTRGSARTRTGGGTRGAGELVTLSAVAPDHVGLTYQAQPSLAWFTATALQGRVDFTLTDPDAVEPLLEVTLPSPFEAGFQWVRLSDFEVVLKEGRSYDWSVALVRDAENRDLDVVASGAIRRQAEPGDATSGQEGEPIYAALARSGIWYDAIANLSGEIEAHPEDPALRAERLGLLEQVGVAAIVAHERLGIGETPENPVGE